jgi:hypothetical protein
MGAGRRVSTEISTAVSSVLTAFMVVKLWGYGAVAHLLQNLIFCTQLLGRTGVVEEYGLKGGG